MIQRGSRVRLRHDIERYPHFIARAGATGIVVRDDTHMLAVRLDDYVPGAEEWDNEVQFYDGTERDALEEVNVRRDRALGVLLLLGATAAAVIGVTRGWIGALAFVVIMGAGGAALLLDG